MKTTNPLSEISKKALKNDYKSTLKDIESFLKSIPLKQQAMYSLLFLFRSCLDYIQRFVSLIDVVDLYPKVEIKDFDEKFFNKEKYELTLRSFLNILRKIFEKLTETRKDQYIIFIHNEIICVKHLIERWKNAAPFKIDDLNQYIDESDDIQQIIRQYAIPNIETISKFINERSPFLFLYQNVFYQINDFLKSLKYNQQALFSLLYLIRSVDKFLVQDDYSLGIDTNFSLSINLYEEYYNEQLYSNTLQLFLDNLAKVYNQIISNPQVDHMVSINTLNSFIEFEIQKISKITQRWSYLHIVFPDWHIKQLYE